MVSRIQESGDRIQNTIVSKIACNSGSGKIILKTNKYIIGKLGNWLIG
jgi:hypothetical protein